MHFLETFFYIDFRMKQHTLSQGSTIILWKLLKYNMMIRFSEVFAGNMDQEMNLKFSVSYENKSFCLEQEVSMKSNSLISIKKVELSLFWYIIEMSITQNHNFDKCFIHLASTVYRNAISTQIITIFHRWLDIIFWSSSLQSCKWFLG